MQNNKENLFSEKFRLLNTQDYNDEINLVSSSSSDYEAVTYNSSIYQNNSRNKKRKRKNKCIKDVSSLDVTIKDVLSDSKRDETGNGSPILRVKSRSSTIQRQNILQQSPILRTLNVQQKSPILSLKTVPQTSLKVKKQLFHNTIKSKNINDVSKEFDIDCKVESYRKQTGCMNKVRISQNLEDEVITGDKNSQNLLKDFVYSKTQNINDAKKDLIKKVKSFFESHFSSEEISQHTISDSQTSSRSEELDIFTCKSESKSDSPIVSSIKEQIFSPENNCEEHEETKKVRYKKEGLAYRLNNLLKKRKAHISLWQHERYLAGNSNFVIPKQEHIVFLIQKVHFKYGCYLLEACDIGDKLYCVVINNCYMNENIKNESVIKLYKPYQFININDKYKLVINVCKFQIVNIK